jgi:hypothetical protein
MIAGDDAEAATALVAAPRAALLRETAATVGDLYPDLAVPRLQAQEDAARVAGPAVLDRVGERLARGENQHPRRRVVELQLRRQVAHDRARLRDALGECG